MTIAQMIESMAGKAGALHGHPQDCTPFQFSEEDTATDFFGHQLSLHLVGGKLGRLESTLIDNDQVPARHFGVILADSLIVRVSD